MKRNYPGGVKMSAKKSVIASIAIASLSIFSPIAIYASPSPTASATPSVHPHPTGIASRPALTEAQEDVIAAANTAYALAKANAREGFDRAMADAKAIRDQAIAAAGKNKSEIKVAQRNFHDFYKTISNAYKVALTAAKLTRQSALAAAHVPAGTN